MVVTKPGTIHGVLATVSNCCSPFDLTLPSTNTFEKGRTFAIAWNCAPEISDEFLQLAELQYQTVVAAKMTCVIPWRYIVFKMALDNTQASQPEAARYVSLFSFFC